MRSALLLLALAAPLAAADYPAAGKGSLSFTVTPHRERFPMRKDFVLLSAVSADGSERYELHVIAEDLLVLRDFGRCIRAADRVPHDFKKGRSYRFKLAWNGESTKFYVDGREVEGFNLLVVDKFDRGGSKLKVGAGPDFEIGDIAADEDSLVTVDPADRAFVAARKCPDMMGLLDAPAQEEHRGVSLMSFPGQKERDTVKAYIDLLPEGMAAALKRVIFVPKTYNPEGAWKGMALQGGGTILLQEISLRDPRTFFHESAHLYDYAVSRRDGKPASRVWAERFAPETLRVGPGDPLRGHSVLDQFDGSAAHEEFADLVGLAYDNYLKPIAGGGRFWTGREHKGELESFRDQGFIPEEVREKLEGGR